MEKFKVGDQVKIKDPGYTYETYNEKFKELGFTITSQNNSFDTDTIGTIFAITDHEWHANNDDLLAVRDEEGNECLIGVEGVELYKGPFDATYQVFDMTTNEGRLAYARKYYPIGTRYYNTAGDYQIVKEEVRKYSPSNIISGEGTGLIYDDNTRKWGKIMEKQILTREQVKEIYDMACADWKKIINKYVLDNTGTFSNEVTFDNEMVSKMFKAATASQLPVLERLLKNPPPQIEYNRDYVYIFKQQGTYKLHRLSNDGYAWIDMFSSNCWANGAHNSAEIALEYVQDKGIEMKVLKSEQEVIEYFKSL